VSYELVYDNVGPAADIGLAIPIDNLRGIDATRDGAECAGAGHTITLLATGWLHSSRGAKNEDCRAAEGG